MNYYNDILKSIKRVLIYLRKSREDYEYEKKSQDYDTLARHRARLISILNDMGLKISEEDIYEEVVSGDSISERPVVQEVLLAIEKEYDAVAIIDVQRLTRGGYTDQGRIIDTFKYTNTLIITPDKIFDLNNKADEEYFADKLNFSRKEYDHIKKRLNDGRKDSVKEGKFIGSRCAYGYKRVKLEFEKGYSLEIVEEQAKILRKMGKMILEGKGTFAIATYLNNLGIKTEYNCEWAKNGIRELLRNWELAGYVKWQERKTVRVFENGKLITKIIRQKLPACFNGETVDEKDLQEGEYLICKGKHKGIFTYEEFKKIQEKLDACSTKYVPTDLSLKNPLAGILVCAKCNLVMARREGTATYWTPRKDKTGTKHIYPAKPIVSCSNKKRCGTVTHTLSYIENLIIEALTEWLVENKKVIKEYNKNSANLFNEELNKINILNNEIEKEEIKLERIMDLLEDGTYTKELYNKRSTPIQDNIKKLKQNIKDIEKNSEQVKMDKVRTLIPKIEKCIKLYPKLEDVKQKNDLLHTVLEKVLYTKTKSRNDSDLQLDIYPKL